MKLLLRIILSPFILLYAYFLVAAMMMFPLTFIIMISFIAVVLYPFVWIIRQSSNAPIECFMIDDPLLKDITKYTFINHLLALLIPVWGPFAITWQWIYEGTIWTVE